MASKSRRETDPAETGEDVYSLPDGLTESASVESSPTAVTFDKDGDEFSAMWVGPQQITPPGTDADGKPHKPFTQWIFRRPKPGDGYEHFAVPDLYKLRQAFEELEPQTDQWVRMRRVGEVVTRRGLNPMIDFKVSLYS